ncbi:hypothetical protein BN2475_550012 [Paraburkholderia ribeironis]|uniref:Uncharacterized protein n=1 Tax=Paraburkholderia ribeironis TaxID=1247936 RepID=A0A1N7SDF4_9BURK|nr:hypothetical protein BN2475_550012 [Paraburkholderia ribeironis]
MAPGRRVPRDRLPDFCAGGGQDENRTRHRLKSREAVTAKTDRRGAVPPPVRFAFAFCVYAASPLDSAVGQITVAFHPENALCVCVSYCQGLLPALLFDNSANLPVQYERKIHIFLSANLQALHRYN